MNDRIVSIIGLGLMGGSLGLALKSGAFAGTVRGYARRAETRERAKSLQVVDEVFDSLDAAVAGADIVVFCTPVCSVASLLADCLSSLKSGVLVTDVGSTKGDLSDAITEVLGDKDVRYVGSHPICGSEQDGIEAARGDLYSGAVTVVNTGAVGELVELWESVGSRVVELSPQAHDAVLARTSHIPHLLASLLVELVADSPECVPALCGSGFRDTTRVAGGPSTVWRDITVSNAYEISRGLLAYREKIDAVLDMLSTKDAAGLEALLESARIKREQLGSDR